MNQFIAGYFLLFLKGPHVYGYIQERGLFTKPLKRLIIYPLEAG
jgi:hypothetical protein